MRKLAYLGMAVTLAACANTSDDLNETDIGVSQITATVEFDEDTGNYIVTPAGGTPEVYFRDATGDTNGFDFASPDFFSFLLTRSEEGARATLLVEDILDASSTVVLLSRTADGELPDADDVTYKGDYVGVLFANDLFVGEVTGDATINVDLDEREVGGTVTDRTVIGLFDIAEMPDITLEQVGIASSGGQVSNAIASLGAPGSGDDAFLFEGSVFTNTTGSYSGLISGENGEYFIGGVELDYDITVADEGDGREVGAIFAGQVEPPLP